LSVLRQTLKYLFRVIVIPKSFQFIRGVSAIDEVETVVVESKRTVGAVDLIQLSLPILEDGLNSEEEILVIDILPVQVVQLIIISLQFKPLRIQQQVVDPPYSLAYERIVLARSDEVALHRWEEGQQSITLTHPCKRLYIHLGRLRTVEGRVEADHPRFYSPIASDCVDIPCDSLQPLQVLSEGKGSRGDDSSVLRQQAQEHNILYDLFYVVVQIATEFIFHSLAKRIYGDLCIQCRFVGKV
jgi:hypothetical protein